MRTISHTHRRIIIAINGLIVKVRDCTLHKNGGFLCQLRTRRKKEAQQRADAKRAGKRARAWTALMYQESAPDGWMEKLSNLLVEALISPLHDQDVWTVEDEVENTSHKAGESPRKPIGILWYHTRTQQPMKLQRSL